MRAASSSLIKEFELNGKRFAVYNAVSDGGYTYFRVYLLTGKRWSLELEKMVLPQAPGMAWSDVESFIKMRSGLDNRIDEFVAKLKAEK